MSKLSKLQVVTILGDSTRWWLITEKCADKAIASFFGDGANQNRRLTITMSTENENDLLIFTAKECYKQFSHLRKTEIPNLRNEIESLKLEERACVFDIEKYTFIANELRVRADPENDCIANVLANEYLTKVDEARARLVMIRPEIEDKSKDLATLKLKEDFFLKTYEKIYESHS